MLQYSVPYIVQDLVCNVMNPQHLYVTWLAQIGIATDSHIRNLHTTLFHFWSNGCFVRQEEKVGPVET